MTFSIRGLFRGGVGVNVPGRDRRLAQELLNRGSEAEVAGALADAVLCYRRAIAADPGFAVAHLNLGIALQSVGEDVAALESYREAIALDPEFSAAHYNLALARLTRQEYASAEEGFRAALRFRPDFPEAWVGLAAALESLGGREAALAALESAIAKRSDYVGALSNAGSLSRKLGRLEAAAEYYRHAAEAAPEQHLGHYQLGTVLHDLGRLPEAEASYRRALAAKPDCSEAQTNLALVLQMKGRNAEAMRLLFDAVAAQPDNRQSRRILANALEGASCISAGEKERSVLMSLCMDEDVSMRSLNRIVIDLLKNEAGFCVLQKSEHSGADPFAPISLAVKTLLRDPLMLVAIPRMTISDAEVETVLTHVRRHVLLRYGTLSKSNAQESAVPHEFVCALARQSFFSGYAFIARDDELRCAATARQTLESALRDPGTSIRKHEVLLAVFALFDSLTVLEGCERLLQLPFDEWSEAFRPLVQEQLEDRRRERQMAGELRTLTSISDPGSLAVRAQYEQNPYPRWVSVQRTEAESFEDLVRRLRPGLEIRDHPRPVQILIAGCGTGHHPIQLARRYPDSRILALDLSVASLSYAMRMSERLGVANIDYCRGDILELGALRQRFSIVQSCGVLHHLNDPLQGWRVLVDLMEPDGLMLIALYSKQARAGISAARKYLKAVNLPQTPEGIRRARHVIFDLPAGHPARDALLFEDFYTLDGCRDLLMHVCEHQFTVPLIADSLDRLGLQFIEFECILETSRRFKEMFPGGLHDADLAAWHQFEQAYPDTFKGMYTFWCCKR